MSDDKDVLAELVGRRLSRRDLMKRVGALGLAAPTLPALLAACAGGSAASMTDADKAAAALQPRQLPERIHLPPIAEVKTRGNVGETPTWYTDLKVTAEQVKEIRGKRLKAAFLNWSSGAYNQAVYNGAKDAASLLGINVVAETNYNFNSGQLQSDVLNVLALEPNIVFYSGVNPVSDRAALDPLVKAGAGVVSYANAPGGWTTGKPNNFVTLISYNTHTMGAVVADAIHDKYPAGANVGVIYFDAEYKLVNEREQGFAQQLAKYPNLKVVAKAPMTDPAGTQPIASAMIARNPEINVIFAPWDQPAEGVAAALDGAGRKDIKIASIDLGFTGARQIASDSHIFVEGADLVYDWGRVGSIAAGLHAIGVAVPPYVLVPAFAVTKKDLLESWPIAYGPEVPIPPEVKRALGA